MTERFKAGIGAEGKGKGQAKGFGQFKVFVFRFFVFGFRFLFWGFRFWGLGFEGSGASKAPAIFVKEQRIQFLLLKFLNLFFTK